MREFKKTFEELGYTFQSNEVLEDIYLFYKYYDNNANKGVSAILLEGDPGCGKTFLSEVFSKFLGVNTEYIYTQCVEETNSDRLIATYNVPAIVKGDADKSIAQGILTKSIDFANKGQKVVLTIDELDKAREVLDSYFLDFLQNGKIETANNETLLLTEEGRKNLYVILAKNNERNLLDALLRRCSVVKLPPMPPVLAYKTLIKNFENIEHDPKFLKFICKVYEAIYNEQMNSQENLLSRLPALQELTTAITSDNELYKNGISSTRRISSLIRKLGKDTTSRDIITNILTKKFKYQNRESNYTNETLDLDMNDPNDYMSTKDADSLVEQYIEKKDNGEYIFEEDEFNDPMRDIANILDNMKDDQSLVFLSKENKERIIELGVITHRDPRALDILFEKVKFKGNPNSRFGFLNFEGDNFIGLMKYKNTLILIGNKEYISPRLLIRGLCTIVTIIYDSNENIDWNHRYFSEINAQEFKLSGFNAKVLSDIPSLVSEKMTIQNGVHTYQNSNLKITYDDCLNVSYFRYLQKYMAEPLYNAIEKMCIFNPELAIPASFINAKKFSTLTDRKLVRSYSLFKNKKEEWESLRTDGWEVKIDNFEIMNLTFISKETSNGYWWESTDNYTEEKDSFVFEWSEKKDYSNKKLYVYPKYNLKNGYLLYTKDKDFYNDENLVRLDPFQKEIALIARNIYGNFIPQFSSERHPNYFSPLTMSQTGRIVEDRNNRNRIPGIAYDITTEPEFIKYYDSLSQPSSITMSNKVLKRTLK